MSSSSGSRSAGSSGVGISTVVQIVFIILKLVGVINWSWFWVLAPTWISILVWLIVIIAIVIITKWRLR